MLVDLLAVDKDGDNLPLIGFIVKLLELPLLLVVINCSDSRTYKDCDKHCESFNPSGRTFLC